MPTALYTRWEFDSDMQNSRLDITDLAILRTWSCPTTKKPDRIAELRASTHLEIKRKLTVSILMDIDAENA